MIVQSVYVLVPRYLLIHKLLFTLHFLVYLQTYASELQRSPHTHYKVVGGFHLNPKGVEMALRVCVLSVYSCIS